jgi:serine/threonine protein kinase/WD40 repeat protein/Tfp pilus assembly protein PilF
MNEAPLKVDGSLESLVGQVADDFLRRQREGERPDVEEYAARYPQAAELLRTVLASLRLLSYSQPGSASPASDGGAVEVEGMLGDYRILREVGRGGMGVVYEAVQLSLGRRVALKVLPFASALDARQLARFKNEAQAAACLHHTNIVPVYAVGQERGVHYYAMQLIEGQTLAAVIQEWRRLAGGRDSAATALTQRGEPNAPPTTIYVPAPPAAPAGAADTASQPALLSREHSTNSPGFFRTVARLGVQAAQGLEHAHGLGVVHRDVKPANLMVAGRGQLWITDFGLAHCQAQAGLTMTGDLVGTLRYMSPEQALGRRVAIDHRTDVYSLGVTLYELLTLEPAFPGHNRAEVLRRIAWDEPAPPRQRNPSVPAELETIVCKAMAKHPDERYQTARELTDDLERFLKDEPIRARRASLAQRARKFARRHRAVVATAALGGVLLLLAVAAVASLMALRLHEANKATLAQLGETQKAEKDGRYRLYQARLAEAQARRGSGRIGQRFAAWEALREAVEIARELGLDEAQLLELRSEAIACLALADMRLVQPEWPGFPPGSSGTLAFDANLERYARSDWNGTISVRRVADDGALARLPGPGPGGGGDKMVFSPDGSLLAVRYWRQIPDSPTNLRIWDWLREKVLFQPSFPVAALTFSPNGQHFALAQPDGTITLHQSPGGKEVRRWSVGFGWPTLAFHPGGSRLAIASIHSHKVRIHDPATGKLIRDLEAKAGQGRVSWHPDGTLLAAGGMDAKVDLWDVATGASHAVLHGHDAHVNGAAFAAGGALLVSSSGDGTTRIWDPWAGQALLRLPGAAQAVSHDGRRLLIQTGTSLRHWELVLSQAYRTLPRNKTGQAESFGSPAFSPDGRWLLASGGRGVWLWDMAREGEGVLLPLARTIDAQFHPRREELFTSGDAGLFRWQARVREGALRIGPSASSLVDGRMQRISLDREGRHLTVVAQSVGGGGRVLDLENLGGKILSLRHDNTIFTATSPDGKWIATGTQHGPGVKLWEAQTGKEHRHLIRDERMATVTFSPDSRWLVTGTGTAFAVWDVVSGNLVREIRREQDRGDASGAAFSPDGKLLAVALGLSEVQLIDSATWRPVARLLGPDPCYLEVGPHAFSPDGGQFVVATLTGNLRVWDLRRIREQLRDLGLDWHLTDYPPHPHAGAKPVKLEVDLGEFQRHTRAREHLARGQEHFGAKRWRQAVAEYSRTLELRPDQAAAYHNRGHAHQELGEFDQALRDLAKAVELADTNARFANNLAWLLATCPREELQDARRAVALAQRAVLLEPRTGAYWNTLGVAYYRVGDWRRAVDALDRSVLHQGGNSWDWFFLAMAHWRIGEKDRARGCCEKAVAWMDRHRPNDPELVRFRAEARELMTPEVGGPSHL